MSSAETLGALVDLAPAEQHTRWLEVACGPGLISRALARRVGSVHGVDLTPAMVEAARRASDEAGLENVSFSLADATDLTEIDSDSFDGAATRFSLHHIPAPERVLAEMNRVVRPGGWVLVGDHVTDEDADGAAWHEQIERLRDPSHWACETPARLRAMAEAVGLIADCEQLIPLDLDFEEWISRGSGGTAAADLVEQLLQRRPAGAESFIVLHGEAGRRLHLRYWLSRWRAAET